MPPNLREHRVLPSASLSLLKAISLQACSFQLALGMLEGPKIPRRPQIQIHSSVLAGRFRDGLVVANEKSFPIADAFPV